MREVSLMSKKAEDILKMFGGLSGKSAKVRQVRNQRNEEALKKTQQALNIKKK